MRDKCRCMDSQSEDDVLDALADELLDRVELSDSISDDSHHS